MPDLSATLAGFRGLAENLVPFLLTGAAVLAGLGVIFFAIRRIYQAGLPGHHGQRVSWGGVALQLLIGGLMLRLAGFMQDLSQLLFGTGIQDIRGVMAYVPLSGTASAWSEVLEVVLLWVLMLGWLGAFKGLLLWNKASYGGDSGQGGDYFWRGFWHLIGGAAAVNLTGMLQSFFGK